MANSGYIAHCETISELFCRFGSFFWDIFAMSTPVQAPFQPDPLHLNFPPATLGVRAGCVPSPHPWLAKALGLEVGSRLDVRAGGPTLSGPGEGGGGKLIFGPSQSARPRNSTPNIGRKCHFGYFCRLNSLSLLVLSDTFVKIRPKQQKIRNKFCQHLVRVQGF